MSIKPQTIKEAAYDGAVRSMSATDSSVSRQANLLLGALESNPNPSLRTIITEHLAETYFMTSPANAPSTVDLQEYANLNAKRSLKEKVAYAAAHTVAVTSISDAAEAAGKRVVEILKKANEAVLSKERPSRDAVMRESALAHFDVKLNDAERADLELLSRRLFDEFAGTHYGANLHAGRERDAQRIFKLVSVVTAARAAGIEPKDKDGKRDDALLAIAAKLDKKLDGLRGYYSTFEKACMARNAFFEANFSAENGEKLSVPNEKEVKALSTILERLGAGTVEKYIESKEPAGIDDVDVAAEEFRRKGREFQAAISAEGWTAEKFNLVFSRYVTQELVYRADAKFHEARLATFGGTRHGEYVRDYSERRLQQRARLIHMVPASGAAAHDQADIDSMFALDRSLFSASPSNRPEYDQMVVLLDSVFRSQFGNMYAGFSAPIAPATIPLESLNMAEAIIAQNQSEHEALFGEGQTMRVRGEMTPKARKDAKRHAFVTKLRDEGIPALNKAAGFLNGALKLVVKVTSTTASVVGDVSESIDSVLDKEVGSIFTPLKLLRIATKPISVIGKKTGETLDKGMVLYGDAEKYIKEKSGDKVADPLQALAYVINLLPRGAGLAGRSFWKSAQAYSDESRQKLLTELFSTCNQGGALNEACERVIFHKILKDTAPRFDLESGELEAPTKAPEALKPSVPAPTYLTDKAPEFGKALSAASSTWNANIRAASRKARTAAVSDHLKAIANVAEMEGLSVLGEISRKFDFGPLEYALKSGSVTAIQDALGAPSTTGLIHLADLEVNDRLKKLRDAQSNLASLRPIAPATTVDDADLAKAKGELAAAQQAYDVSDVLLESFTRMKAAHTSLVLAYSETEIDKFKSAIALLDQLPPVA